MDAIYDYVRKTPTNIVEEQYTAVGASFTLGTFKRAFLGSTFVLRRTAGGTPLVKDSDYALDEKDIYYSQAAFEDEDVFTKINILNATYETGDLYVTYDAVLTYLTSDAIRAHGAPAGVITAYGGAGTVPAGYLLCNGSAVSRTLYAALFTAIATTWGAGDGTTTFNLPDGRGGVLRGTGTGTVNTRDKVGPAVGAQQEDQMQRITGSLNGRIFTVNDGDSSSASGAITIGEDLADTTGRTAGTGRGFNSPSFNSADSPDARASATTDGETRTYSIGVQWIIKI